MKVARAESKQAQCYKFPWQSSEKTKQVNACFENSIDFSSQQKRRGIFDLTMNTDGEHITTVDTEKSDVSSLFKESLRALAGADYFEEVTCDGEDEIMLTEQLSSLTETDEKNSDQNNNDAEFASIQLHSYLGVFEQSTNTNKEENTRVDVEEKSDVSTLFKESFQALANADYFEEVTCDGEPMLTDFIRLSVLTENSYNNCSDHSNNGFEFSSIDAISSRRYETNGDFVLPDFANSEQLNDVIMLDETSSNQILKAMNKSDCDTNEADDCTNESSSVKHVKCANCEANFKYEDFKEHVCAYDENKNYIPDAGENTWNDDIDLPCIRITRENNIMIQRFLNDGPKIYMGSTIRKRGKQQHECTMCDRKFVHAAGLAKHVEKHVMEASSSILDVAPSKTLCAIVKCLLCGQVFSKPGYAMQHLQHFHNTISIIKLEYDAASNEEEDMLAMACILGESTTARRLTEHEKNKDVQMDVEEKVAVEPHKLLRVLIVSSIIQCEFCDFLFCDIPALLAHEVHHNPTNPGYECQSCEIRCATPKDLVLHFKMECAAFNDITNVKIGLQRFFVCNVCEEKFVNFELLYEHRYRDLHFFPRLEVQSNVLLVSCELCGQCTDTIGALLEHRMEKHTKKVKNVVRSSGESSRKQPKHLSKSTMTNVTGKFRQFLCDVCGKSYTQSSHLWQHLRFHRGVKPFQCSEEGCNRKFTIRPDLNDHIRKCHTGERPYHCLICGKRFLTGSVFYQHRLIHRGERRYGCEDCGKRFYRADALKNHQLIHTGEKPFQCEFCVKAFRQRGDRDKHIKARHIPKIKIASTIKQSNKRAPRKRSENSRPASRKPTEDEIVYIASLQLPKSMFQPMIVDIDADQ